MSLQSRPALIHHRSSSISNPQLHRVIVNLPCISNPLLPKKDMLVVRAQENGKPKQEIRLDNLDLMALEFGRLLGEPQEKTMAKVIRKKVNPAASFVEIEKKSKKEREPVNLKKYQIATQNQKTEALKSIVGEGLDLPALASPPMRQRGMLPQTGKSRSTEEFTDDSLLRRPGVGQITKPKLVSRPAIETQKSKLGKQAEIHETRLRKPSVMEDPLVSQESNTSEVIGENILQSPMLNPEILTDTQQSKLVVDADPSAALPALVSRPSRKSSIGIFVSSSRARTPKPSVRSSANGVADESLLRKPALTIISQAPPEEQNIVHEDVRKDRHNNRSSGQNIDTELTKVYSQRNKINSVPSKDEADLMETSTILSSEAKDGVTNGEAPFAKGDILGEKKFAEVPGNDIYGDGNLQIPVYQEPLQSNRESGAEKDISFIKELEERTLSGNGNLVQPHIKLLRPKMSDTKPLLIQSDELHFENKSIESTCLEPQEAGEDEEHANTAMGVLLDASNQSECDSIILEHSDITTAAEQKKNFSEILETLSRPSVQADMVNKKNSNGTQTAEGSNNELPTLPNEIHGHLVDSNKQKLRKPMQLSLSQPLRQKEVRASDSNWLLAKEDEEREWARADALLKSKEQVEVKLIGNSSAGFFVSFGCLVGFLPLFELSSKRGLLDFSSWAQQNGISLGQIKGSVNAVTLFSNGSHDTQNNVTSGSTTDVKELRKKYNEEMLKLMSSFIGEKACVIVKQVDKSTRRLKFSEKEADPDSRELVQRKADLMAELKVGDTVTCEVKSITPIGVFVEIDGVSALIHHSEVSWNTRVDPASLLSIGEVIKARVCRLDRTLQRINLSLRQMQPDPLKLTLESVVGGVESDSTLNEIEVTESQRVVWPELEDLMEKLEKMEGISYVSKGRCLQSNALAPSFQVFLSSPQTDGYTLLARFGNKIQEVLVKTTLDREKLKEYIRMYTFSVA